MDELLLSHWYNIYYYLLVVLCLCVEDDMYHCYIMFCKEGKGLVAYIRKKLHCESVMSTRLIKLMILIDQ